MRVTVLDYGAGNLHSIAKALATASADVAIENDVYAAVDCDALVLPGVGAYGVAVERLSAHRDRIRQAILGGLPTLGICLGMQLLFDRSEEGAGSGLSVIEGDVTRIDAERVPQMGWNSLDDTRDPLVGDLEMAYFANSFACRPANTTVVVAWATHERDRFPAVVRSGSAVGVQFHPEKSSTAGVAFLRRFLDEARR